MESSNAAVTSPNLLQDGGIQNSKGRHGDHGALCILYVQIRGHAIKLSPARMSLSEKSAAASTRLIVHFQSVEHRRSRSVSAHVLHHALSIPQPPTRLSADWDREIAGLGLGIGDIESLSLARTIVRWPDYARCAAAVTAWMQTLHLPDLLDPGDLALMACRGVHYHHDAEQYGHAVFCNLFLSEDKGMDLHYPSLGLRIPLQRGTVVIFDTAQPHAVIPRSSSGFNAADFASDQDCTQVFLTWELPVENAEIKRALQIDFDIDAAGCLKADQQQVCLNGAPLAVCPASGQWRPAA